MKNTDTAQFPVSGRLGCFHFGGYSDRNYDGLPCKSSCGRRVSFLLGKCPGAAPPADLESVRLTPGDAAKPLAGALVPSTRSAARATSCRPASLSALRVVRLPGFTHPRTCEMLSHRGFNLHFLRTSVDPLAICILLWCWRLFARF